MSAGSRASAARAPMESGTRAAAISAPTPEARQSLPRSPARPSETSIAAEGHVQRGGAHSASAHGHDRARLVRVCGELEAALMANPYHDPRSGEFTSGPGGSSAEKSHKNVPQPLGEQVRERYTPNIDTQALTSAGAAKNAGREWARNHVGGSSMEARRLAGQRYKSEFERKNFMEGVESIRNPPPSPYAKSNPEDASPFSGPHS